jgi:tRNA nucleotidyltransferase (CCA-adding enzyme)
MTEAARLLELLPGPMRDLLRQCASAAAARGESAFLVGGPVRDLILGCAVDDIDVMVVGDGMAVAQAVARQLGGALTRHHAFRTARVDLPDGTRLDVASARSETYRRPGELPRVAAGELEDDLARRDFTINAMALALDEAAPELQDPFGGRADLQAGRIRILHGRSFADDPTRMLRALRFALRLGYELEERTADALADGVRGGFLDSLTGDRLRRELAKLLAEAPVAGPVALADTGLSSGLDPGLQAPQSQLEALSGQDELRTVAAAHGEGAAEWTLTLAAMASELQLQERWELSRRLRMSREDRLALIGAGARWGEALAALRAIPDAAPSAVAGHLDDLHTAVVRLGHAAAEAAGEGDLARQLYRYLRADRWVRPILTGDDLIALGCGPGPEVGQALQRLRAARIDEAAFDEADERRLLASWGCCGAN